MAAVDQMYNLDVHKILAWKPHRERARRRWEDNVVIDHRAIVC
jgi:hypothetical protein